MAQRLKPVDVVTIGVGLTGSLAGLELAKAGLGCACGSRTQETGGVMAVVDDGGWPMLTLRMDNAAYVAWLDRRDEYMQQFCRLLVTG